MKKQFLWRFKIVRIFLAIPAMWFCQLKKMSPCQIYIKKEHESKIKLEGCGAAPLLLISLTWTTHPKGIYSEASNPKTNVSLHCPPNPPYPHHIPHMSPPQPI